MFASTLMMIIISVIATHWYVRLAPIDHHVALRSTARDIDLSRDMALISTLPQSHSTIWRHCSNLMLVNCKVSINANPEKKKEVVTYGEVAEASFGKAGIIATDALLLFTQFGFCCVYIIFVSQNTANFFFRT